MTIGSIFLGLALLILVALFVGRPLLAPEAQRQRRVSRRRVLLTQKEALLAQIRLIDLDFETGKMPEEVYQQQRAQLMAEATAVLQQLDDLEGQPGTFDADTGLAPADADSAIEAAIARRRNIDVAAGTTATVPASQSDEVAADAAIEAAIARRRVKTPAPKRASQESQETALTGAATSTAQTKNGKARFCPQCGQSADASDRFCAYCGHRFSQTQPA